MKKPLVGVGVEAAMVIGEGGGDNDGVVDGPPPPHFSTLQDRFGI
jgi:hypothetical protein